MVAISEWSWVGKHRLRIEGDIFVSINDGPMTLTEMQTMTRILQRAVEKDGVRYFLLNLTRAEAPSPEARRWMTQNPYQGLDAVGAYGANRALRLLSDLIGRALNLLHRSRKQTPFRLFATEADARAFFDTLRAELRERKVV